MPPEEFEPSVPARKKPQTNALDRAATGIGSVAEYVKIFGKGLKETKFWHAQYMHPAVDNTQCQILRKMWWKTFLHKSTKFSSI